MIRVKKEKDLNVKVKGIDIKRTVLYTSVAPKQSTQNICHTIIQHYIERTKQISQHDLNSIKNLFLIVIFC